MKDCQITLSRFHFQEQFILDLKYMSEKKVCILSIDGGGIRGIIPAVIIEYLEQQLQLKTKNEDARICDFFDLIAGTSTGGILTCLYLVPGENNRPRYNASDALELYLKHGTKIFSESAWQKFSNPFRIRHAKYSPKYLEKVLNKYLMEIKLSKSLKPCLITAYDIFQRKAVFFNQTDTIKQGNIKNFRFKDIARSTSAAPTYFPPTSIKSEFGAPYYLIDGGMFANNPAMCAYTEAKEIDFNSVLKRTDKKNKPDTEDILIVSIGTGSQEKPYSYNKANKWGVAGWLQPIIDILMSGNSETVSYELNLLFNSGTTKNYYRLEPGLGTAKSDIDLATSENMKALKLAGKSYITKEQVLLDNIVDLLIQNQ